MQDSNHAAALEAAGVVVAPIYVLRDQNSGWSETFQIEEVGQSVDYSSSVITFRISQRPGSPPLATGTISSRSYNDPVTSFGVSVTRSTLDGLPTRVPDYNTTLLYYELEIDGRLDFAGDYILIEGAR